jgi:hypothetical protein
MPLDFTIVVHVRAQFGNVDQNVGVYAGLDKSWQFACPQVSSDYALLLFQSSSVEREQKIAINGNQIPGGIPNSSTGDFTALDTTGHSHFVALPGGWAGNVLIIGQRILKSTKNSLRITSSGEEFLVDNVVVIYKTP